MPYPGKLTVVLDSGAYTAWTKGRPIKIEEYCDYIEDHKDVVSHYVALDVIPGVRGKKPTSDDIEKAARASWDNLLYMKDRGLDPVPVYHQGEDIKWLQRMMDLGCTYIGISPSNDHQPATRKLWLDKVFDYITDNEGWPVIRTHGFGVTSIPLLFRYPWHSADSTSWALFSAYGFVLVPRPSSESGARYRYDTSPISVRVSDSTSMQLSEDFQGFSMKPNSGPIHFDQIPGSSRDYVLEYLDFIKADLSKVRASYQEREVVNLRFFSDVAKFMPKRPYQHKRRGFL